MRQELNAIAVLLDGRSRAPHRASSFFQERQGGLAMKSKMTIYFFMVSAIVLVASSCVGFTYSSTGRAWTVRAGESIKSDPIRVRRTITFQASGQLEAGTVTASVYRDGLLEGQPIAIQAGNVDLKVEYDFKEGLWSFGAQADQFAQGELYLSISDE